jgi:hypothetical protein
VEEVEMMAAAMIHLQTIQDHLNSPSLMKIIMVIMQIRPVMLVMIILQTMHSTSWINLQDNNTNSCTIPFPTKWEGYSAFHSFLFIYYDNDSTVESNSLILRKENEK